MIKNRTIIESEINGREFRLECPSEATWEEVVMIIEKMKSFAQERIVAIKSAQEKEIPELPIEEVN